MQKMETGVDLWWATLRIRIIIIIPPLNAIYFLCSLLLFCRLLYRWKHMLPPITRNGCRQGNIPFLLIACIRGNDDCITPEEISWKLSRNKEWLSAQGLTVNVSGNIVDGSNLQMMWNSVLSLCMLESNWIACVRHGRDLGDDLIADLRVNWKW